MTKTPNFEEKAVSLDRITFDESIQPRAKIDAEVLAEYTELWQDTAANRYPFDSFPVIFRDEDGNHWIGDGWHRLLSARDAGRASVKCRLADGTREDAVRWALTANTTHGLRRRPEDIKHTIQMSLNELGRMSNRAIADACGLSEKTVRRHRSEMKEREPAAAGAAGTQAKRVGRDGKSYSSSKPVTKKKPKPSELAADCRRHLKGLVGAMDAMKASGGNGVAFKKADAAMNQIEAAISAMESKMTKSSKETAKA